MSSAASSSPNVAGSGNTEGQRTLRLGGRSFGPRQRLIMAIVNRTPDSFYDRGATWEEKAAMERVHEVVGEGADIVDIGGVPAAPGAEVTVAEEIRRTVPFVAAVRAAYPDLVISVDTWRHQTARELLAAGADLLVVGSRGHGKFAEALLGSVSQNCVHHASCPVLIMRGEPGQAAS